MTSKVVTKDFNVHNARQFIESISEEEADNYYLCFGKHTQYSGSDSTIETPTDTFRYKSLNIYDDMIFGKKVSSSDVNLMVDKTIWASNTVYDMYDDQADMSNATFYVATLDGSNYNVYKCLDNANGAPSTYLPSTIDTAAFVELDGYTWKYMYTITAANWTKFSTTSYMPVYTNTIVSNSAVDRAIDVILTEYSGSYYNNHFSGEFETGTQIVSSTSFKLSGNAVSLNDYYKGCIIEFTTDSGIEYKEITDYVVSGSNKTITIANAVTNNVAVGDTYQIYPKVNVYGDGSESNTCLAWAVINASSSNSVSKVEVLQVGKGYRVTTANVEFDASVNVTDEATLRPIISPKMGHGYYPADELIAHKVCISVSVANTESNNLVAENDFRNVALLKNPEFDKIKVEYVGTTNIFDIDELVYQYRPIQIQGTVSVNASSNAYLFTGTSTDFENALEVNDYVLVQNSSADYIGKVTTISNSTTLVVDTAVSANMSSANISIAIIQATGNVSTYLSNSVTLTKVSNNFSNGSYIIGSNSFASITASGVKNNSRTTNDLNTFQQTVRFEGTKTSTEDFTEDEIVYQQGTYADENLRPIGRVFHYLNDTTDLFYITNERNIFSSNAVLVGNSSEAIFVATDKYNGDLIKDSGEIVYIMNVEAISRSNTTTETVKITLNF